MKAIAAMSCNRVIGIDGNLPWKNKRDLRFFKTITLGSKLVMGRKTFESTGLLPHRTFHVVTNNTDHKNIIDASTGRDIVTYGKIESVDIDGKNNSWLCGGAEMYKKLLPVCTDLYLTIMLDDFDGDTEMPEFEGYLPQQRIIKEFNDMWIIHYWNSESILENVYRSGFDYQLTNSFSGGQGTANCPYPFGSKEFEHEKRLAWISGYTDAPVMKWEN